MDVTPKMIQRYFNQECTTAEAQAVEAWITQHGPKQDPLAEMSAEEQHLLQNRMYQSFLDQTETTRHKRSTLKNLQSNRFRVVSLRIAVSVVLFLGFWGYWTINHKPEANVSVRAKAIQISNHSNAIARRVLPDHSTVWLSPHSSIAYANPFKHQTRTVRLLGEAFFEVMPDKKCPFIIYSNRLVTKVWGTSFKITAFPGLAEKVAVMTGKVSVRDRQPLGKEVMLIPQEEIVHDREAGLLKRDVKPFSDMRIWNRASLQFKDEQLDHIFVKLEKQFKIQIQCDDRALKQMLFTGDFENQSLPAILEVLKISMNADYKVEKPAFFRFYAHSSP